MLPGMQMGATSEGEGKGCTFFVEIPYLDANFSGQNQQQPST
jgi:hypothetical protein